MTRFFPTTAFIVLFLTACSSGDFSAGSTEKKDSPKKRPVTAAEPPSGNNTKKTKSEPKPVDEPEKPRPELEPATGSNGEDIVQVRRKIQPCGGTHPLAAYIHQYERPINTAQSGIDGVEDYSNFNEAQCLVVCMKNAEAYSLWKTCVDKKRNVSPTAPADCHTLNAQIRAGRLPGDLAEETECGNSLVLEYNIRI